MPLVARTLLGGAEAIAGVLPDHPGRKRAVEVEDTRNGRLHLRDVHVEQPPLLERPPVDVGTCEKRVRAGHERDDLLHLVFAVAEAAESPRHRLVYDLEVTTPSKLLELH